MSISGLSNHLYVVVTTIISLLVAPSTFHQTRASLVSNDFTESRQFKKNLAVSKYRDNPYWLPNYSWKPPEKFHGPRKRPKWEMETTTESEGSLLKQKELEKWEKKMRDLSKRARRKWTAYEAQEKSPPKSHEIISGRTDEKFVSDEDARSAENNDDDTNAKDGRMNNLENGRWGMSVKKAPKNFMKEISKSQLKSHSTDSLKSLETRKSMRQPNDDVKRTAAIPNGRWGMSVKKAPKNFIKEISKSQPKPLENTNSMTQRDNSVKNTATISNGHWAMSSNKVPKDFPKKISKSRKSHQKSLATDSPKPLESINSMSHHRDNGVKSSGTISTGRWDMSVKKAPKELLKEMSRRSQTLPISDRVWKQDEDPKSTGNRKIHDGSEVRVKEVSVAEGPVEKNLRKVFPSGRWGMSSDLPPREFLREISRRGLSGIPEFYKSTAVHQRAHEIAKNNLQSRKFMFSQTSEISNIPFPRLFPYLIGQRACPICLFVNLKILPDYNCPLFLRIFDQRQFP